MKCTFKLMNYKLELSSGDKIAYEFPCVTTKGINGHYCPKTERTLIPDTSNVRDRLPYKYRKAWDRYLHYGGGGIWFVKDTVRLQPATIRLVNYRGKALVTLFFWPQYADT